jgi:cytochrome P450
MRVTPPLVGGFAKKVPPGGDVICGKALPAGTEVHVNFVSLMRDAEVFGPDVEIFRPERFLESDESVNSKRRKVVDLNFGYGRWMCLGRVLALIEMNKIFVEVSGSAIH